MGRRDSTDTDDLLDRAWAKLDDGDFAAARRLAAKIEMAEPESFQPALLLAECAWGEGHLDEAVQHATTAVDRADEADEHAVAVSLKARLELEKGDVAAARKTLAGLPPAGADLGDPFIALDAAELLLEVEDAEGARERLTRLVASDPEMADAWYVLGLAAEQLGDDAARTAAWLKARALDAAPIDEDEARLDEAEFASVAEAALLELPERARVLLANVPIIVADIPPEADVATGLDPRLLGLFTGTPYPEAAGMGGAPQLTQILLFRRNLERVAHDEEELRDEIRTTLLHETGHFFGMDEDDLEAVGLD